MANEFTNFIAKQMTQKEAVKENMSKIKNKIGVYSAKGGVGKTTVAINLAYTLKEKGFKVGLLDADIDCPNVPLFLNMNKIYLEEIKPIEFNGVYILSTSFFTDDEKRPIIWRGPLIAKMVDEFLEHAQWPELDYLIVDLPPGTSDAPLSLMQLLDLNGFLLVTTPQRIAAINTIRSGLMAKRLNMHIYGVIENMSSNEPKGALEVAKSLDCKFLGSIRENKKISELEDSGKIPVIEDNEIKKEFENIANKLLGV